MLEDTRTVRENFAIFCIQIDRRKWHDNFANMQNKNCIIALYTFARIAMPPFLTTENSYTNRCVVVQTRVV